MDKDALDVFRLLRGTTTEDLADRYRRLLADPRSEETSRAAIALTRTQFADPRGAGVQMIVRAIGLLGDPQEIVTSCTALTGDLLASLDT